MAKATSVFTCQQCGANYPKWSGQCSSCGQWNTLVESVRVKTAATNIAGAQQNKAIQPGSVLSFSEVELAKRPKRRFSTMIGELDRVLGGGVVPGEVVLLGGEPGIGKSTLLTQLLLLLIPSQTAASIAQTQSEQNSGPFLYICGEENPQQIALRINRLLENEHFFSDKSFAKTAAKIIGRELQFVVTTDVDELVSIIADRQPQLVIVDSIQTLHTTDLQGAEGSVGQIRESTQRLTEVAKRQGSPLFLVGHVTKEGTIAGPKVLEHMVDAVIELSGERTSSLRLLRAVKNRFGATDEVGVFQMADGGLREVTNPSELFLEHSDQPVAGAVTVCVMEGTRPLLVEVQALVVPSQLAMPRRVGRGIELNRIQVLSAVLQKHSRLPLGTTDIFLSAAGGFTIREPAVDLGSAVAIASSLAGKALPPKTVFVGEVGLLGEIRSVSFLEQRIKEVKRLGYERIISRQTHRRVQDVLKEFGLERPKRVSGE